MRCLEVGVGHDAVLEFLFGCDADVAQHGAGELGEEALDEIEPGAKFRREGEFEATDRLMGEPSLGLLGDVRGMIVEDQLDRRTRAPVLRLECWNPQSSGRDARPVSARRSLG